MLDMICLHSSFSIRSVDNYTHLKWNAPPKNILVVHKLDDPVVISGLKSVVFFLLKFFRANVLLEEVSIIALRKETDFEPLLSSHLKMDGLGDNKSVDQSHNYDFTNDWQSFPTIWTDNMKWQHFPNSNIVVFDSALATQHQLTDLVICMGGDGTLLHVGSIFQNTVPPVLPFYMGSLGFLTPFNFDQFPRILKQFCTEGGPCLLRARLCCRLIRRQHSESPNSNDGLQQSSSTSYHVLNETTFSRGNCPYLSDLILSADGKRVTSIQGDGLIVSTPTGSTAYSMSANASILNAAVPALLITPINPHTLSCRPLVLPIGTRLEVQIDPEARAGAIHLSNDGRLSHRHILQKGDRVIITASHYPLPCFCPETQVADWFRDLAHCLNWNVRHQQNRFDEARFLPDKFQDFNKISGNDNKS